MRRRCIAIGTLAWAAMLETARRKDVYVVWFLSLFMLGAGSVFALMGVRGLEIFLRDLALTVVNLLSLIVCVWLAARQVPEEISRRTLFPLLARPIRRSDVLLGKWLAVWVMATGALLVLAGIAAGELALFGVPVPRIFWQYLILRTFSFAVIAALVVALSLVTTPAATVTLSLLLTIGATYFAGTLTLVYHQAASWTRPLLVAVYYLVPHLDLFDLSKKTAFGWPPIPAWVLTTLALYGAAYTAVFLGLAHLRFRRIAL
ncbi:MAG: ABC transporter permease [Armatimonadetes bacterium]|nr:ABC transporter permease [Armatimonadota bacterium]